MSHLTYHNYEGYGTAAKEQFHYSQSVRIGDYIHVSGQGGWDPRSTKPPFFFPGTEKDEKFQIDQAWKNVEIALNEAGADIKDVFQVCMLLISALTPLELS